MHVRACVLRCVRMHMCACECLMQNDSPLEVLHTRFTIIDATGGPARL